MLTPEVSWAEKYRPKTLNELIFPNSNWKKIIEDWITTGHIGGNIALFGPGGFGKSSLSELIIKSIIKNQHDLKRIKTRSVQEIETIGDFIRSKPIASPIKIIYIEEADGLSSQAQRELKEKYTEKFQDHCSIILTSNYPYSIDEFLLQRFLYKIDFSRLNITDVISRLQEILTIEKSKYNETELINWVENNISSGMRNMINMLQLSHKLNDGQIILTEINSNKDLEDKVIGLCLNIISNYISADLKLKKAAYINPIGSSIIGSDWVELVQCTHNNYGIDYKNIFEEIDKQIKYLPVKKIIGEYLENLSTKKYPHIHLLSCLSDVMRCIVELNF